MCLHVVKYLTTTAPLQWRNNLIDEINDQLQNLSNLIRLTKLSWTFWDQIAFLRLSIISVQTIKISSQRLFGRGAGTYHRFLKWAGGGGKLVCFGSDGGGMHPWWVSGCYRNCLWQILSNLRRTMLLSFDNQIVSFTEYLKTKLTFAQIPICLNNRRLNHIVN